MFTGIVEEVGTVLAVDRGGSDARLVLRGPLVSADTVVGGSIAVDGVCLTVTDVTDGAFTVDVMPETLRRSTLGRLVPGGTVNLERAVPVTGRLDGHIVQGHVDGTGRIRRLERRGNDVRLFVECGPEILDGLIEKGSVAIDGVSLTVVGLDASGFDVALISHTLAATTLGERRPGDLVNLEADVLGKYVRRQVERLLGREGRRD